MEGQTFTARVQKSIDFAVQARLSCVQHSAAAAPKLLQPAILRRADDHTIRMRVRNTLGLLLAARAAAEPVERREIRSVDEFRRLVQTSPRVFLVEFFSGMCGYCQEFEPTWLELARTTTRLEPARVNIDMPGGLAVAELVGVINEGIPAVVLFNQRRTDSHTTLMAGELEEVPKLLRRVYKATKGKYLSTDAEGFFLRAS